jgi:RNase adapter protein RapZ
VKSQPLEQTAQPPREPARALPSPYVVIVTGMSGAGKSQAAKCLEDLGYFCVDNLPPSLIPKFAELFSSSSNLRRVALVLDIRGEEMFGDLVGQLRALSQERVAYRVVFLDASDEVLVRRYSETRRKHPLSDRGRIIDSIVAERGELKPIRDAADVIIDTSTLTLAALKQRLAHAADAATEAGVLNVSIVAFGYKYGVPLDADLVFDVRFLPNPNYVEELRELTGAHPAVVAYLRRDEDTQVFMRELFRFIDFLLPRFEREGKAHLTIAIGCTGGRHRSVFLANELATHLRDANVRATAEFRDAQR